jgi:hypothetical protein
MSTSRLPATVLSDFFAAGKAAATSPTMTDRPILQATRGEACR